MMRFDIQSIVDIILMIDGIRNDITVVFFYNNNNRDGAGFTFPMKAKYRRAVAFWERRRKTF